MLELKFILTYDSTDYIVDEPDGFKNFNSVLERDFDTHGVFFQFTDSDLKLKFPGTGRDVLKAARDGFGVDATVDITVKRRFRSTDDFTTIYTGTAIIENLELDEDFASCDFEEINDMIKIKDRLDVVVSTDATEDMDGGAVSSATAITLNDTGKTIKMESFGQVPSLNNAGGEPVMTTTSGGWFSNSFSVEVLEDEVVYRLTDNRAFRKTVPDINSAIANVGARFYADAGSVAYDLRFKVIGGVWVVNISNLATGTVDIKLNEYTYDLSGETLLTTNTIGTINFADYNSSDLTDRFYKALDYSNSYTVEEDNKFYEVVFEHNTLTGAAQIYGKDYLQDPTFKMGIEVDTIEPASNISSFFIHEALRHNIEVVTGRNMLYAPYFGRTTDGYDENGCAWNYTEANGYRVRAFSGRANQISLKDRLNSLKSIFGVGYGIERDAPEYDTYRFRVDTLDYFYNNELLYEFDDVVEYKEEYYNWFSFNEVEIGYKKYANEDDEPGTLDDWNTKAGYLMPVNRLRGKKTWLSDYIASDYLIEYTRRKQFSKEPTTSWKYDDDLFIMDVQDSGGTWIPGSPNSMVTAEFENPILFNDLISPRFNFFNQYAIVNSLAYKKVITAEYKNTYYRNNGGGKISYSTLSPTSNCLGDLTERIPGSVAFHPTLKDDIRLSLIRDADRLFDPIKVSFKQALTTTQLDNIIEAHRNGAASANNGYFRVTSPDNETIEGWLLRLSFNYEDQIGNFELIKKADAYSI